MGFLPKNLRKDPGMNPYESSPANFVGWQGWTVGPVFSEKAHTTLKWIRNPKLERLTFYDISRGAKTGWRWENQRCTFVLGEDILVHPWKTAANCSSSAIFVSWKCHAWHIFHISSVCLWEAPFAQRLSQRNKGKELLKKPSLRRCDVLLHLQNEIHLFKDHKDAESLQKTGISRMVGYQVVGCVLFFSAVRLFLLAPGTPWLVMEPCLHIWQAGGGTHVFCI